MPDDAAAVAARLAALPAALVHATPQAVRAGGVVLEQRVRANVASTTGGDSRLSRVRSGRGASIRVDLTVTGAGGNASARVIPSGPIMLVEEDTNPHRSPFQYLGTSGTSGRRYATAGQLMADGVTRARRRRAERQGFLFIPGVGFRAAAKHPGTKGRHPVRDAFTQSGEDAGRAGMEVFTRAVRDALR